MTLQESVQAILDGGVARGDVAGTYISQLFPFGDPRSFALFDSIERACYASLS